MDTKVVKMKGGRYHLSRVPDGAGDSGMFLCSLNPETHELVGEHGEVHLGARVQCGSHFARSYQHQDWWMTSVVTEFLEISPEFDFVKFRTNNSIYELKSR